MLAKLSKRLRRSKHRLEAALQPSLRSPEQSAERGFSLMEMIVVMATSTILLAAFGQMFSAGLRGDRVSSHGSFLLQNSEIATALLQSDVREVAYLGADENTFDGVTPTDAEYALFRRIIRWPFRLGGNTMPPFVVTHGTGGGNQFTGFDQIEFYRVRRVLGSQANPYRLEHVRYGVRGVGNNRFELFRGATELTCAPVATNGQSACTQVGGGLRPLLPAVEGVEEFQIYIRERTSDGGTRVTPDIPFSLSNIASIGIYMRLRGPDFAEPGYSDGRLYPSNEIISSIQIDQADLPANASVAQRLQYLRFPTQAAYTGNEANFRREEKLIEVAFATPLSCNVLPIAIEEAAVSGVSGGGNFTSQSGGMTGNWGWLNWNGADRGGGANRLVSYIENPELYGSSYVNPLDPTDTVLEVGDPVDGQTGFINRAFDAVQANYVGQEVVVLTWDGTSGGTGTNMNFNISGAARIRIDSFTRNGSEIMIQGTYIGPAGSCV